MDILLPLTTKLVKLSLAQGVFPQTFKMAVVTPLIKKALLPSEDLKNYLLVLGCPTAHEHINSNNLDNPWQSAYKTGHSTKTVLHIKMNYISHYHVASPLHLSYSISQLHSTQLTTLPFSIVLSHGWCVCHSLEVLHILFQPPSPCS